MAIDLRRHIPPSGESNVYFEWVDFANSGGHILTPRGREFLLAQVDPYSELHPALVEFGRRYPRVRLPRRSNTIKFQAINLLVDFSPIAFTRDDLDAFFRNPKILRVVDEPPRDSIQSVNKSSQWGLNLDQLRRGGISAYRISMPIPYIGTYVEKTRTGAGNTGRNMRTVAAIKQYLRKNILDVPEESWQLGHRNPSLPLEADNVVMQSPRYNQPRRDRFIFDEWGLVLCPTAAELSANLRRYYADDIELEHLLEAVKRELKRT